LALLNDIALDKEICNLRDNRAKTIPELRKELEEEQYNFTFESNKAYGLKELQGLARNRNVDL
jgi:hypothetical protein